MKKMIKTILLTANFLFFFITVSFAQDFIVLQATEVSLKYKITGDTWGAWTDWENSTDEISIGTKIIAISSLIKIEEIFIITDYEKKSGSNGKVTFYITCKDSNGNNCRMRFISDNGSYQFYVDYPHLIKVYNVIFKD